MSTPGPDDSQPQSPEELGGLNPKELFNAGLESAPPVTVPPQPVDPDVTARMSQPCTGFVIKTRPELPLPEELTTLLPKGAYQVEKFLGQGGMGAVYKGMQLRLKRPVAIKIMRRDFGQDHDFESRFEREAQAMAKLSHPNIVCVHDYGEAGPDYLYIVMELVDGADMMDVIRTRRITQEMALTLLPQICDALQFAHDHGIVHRDIKPSNIMLTRDGRIKMTDFGLAKRFDAESTLHTKTGTGMGSPDYAAPEQFDPNGNIDHRADIYALGVTIYHMITGSLPRGVWKPPSLRVELDPHWDDIVSRAMQSDPKDRYQQASEVKTDVSTIGITPSKAPDAFSPPTPVVRPRRGFDIQGRFHGCGIYLAVSLCALIFGGTYVVNHLEKKEPSMDMALATETREPTLPNLPTPKASDGPLVASAPSPPPPAPSASKPTAGTNPAVDGMKPTAADGVSMVAKPKEPMLSPMSVPKASDGPLVASAPSPPPPTLSTTKSRPGTSSTGSWKKPTTRDEDSIGTTSKEPTSPKRPVAKPSDGPLVASAPSRSPPPPSGSMPTSGASSTVRGAKPTAPTATNRFKIKEATYLGGRSIKNPYDGSTISVTWAQLAGGGPLSDSQGRFMLLPRIKDPHLGAEAMSDDGNVTLVNPYTNKLMFVPGGAGTGDTIPSGLNGFTIKITQMITLKKRFVIQGHFVMALDPKTKWYMGTPGQVIPGGDTRELEAHFNATAKGSVPPNYRFYYDPDKRRMIARPKD